MMQRLIILNGPAGVGKTTVGRALAATARNGVCIHGDDLRNFIVSIEEGTVEQGLGYKNAAILSNNFIEGGYDLVVVDYVFEHRRHVNRFLTWAPPKIPIYLFTLWAPLVQVMEQEQTRAGRERLGKRVEACYNTMQNHLDELGYIVLNDQIDPATLAIRINEAAAAGKGLIHNQEGDSHG